MVAATAFSRSDSKRILALCKCLRRLNLLRPAFALCSREYRPLWNVHVPCDLAQTDTARVGGADFRPSCVRDCPSHSEETLTQKLWGSKFDGPAVGSSELVRSVNNDDDARWLA
jgi:hypothetical protein